MIRKMIGKRLTMYLALLSVMAPVLAQAERFEISGDGTSMVEFESKAPMESFKGKTKRVSGWFEADLENLSGPIQLEVEVDLASFDTGMGKRNQHMRDNHLETDTYPQAWFRAGEIVRSSLTTLQPGQTTEMTVSGSLDLHGVQRDMQCDLTVEHTKDGHLKITGGFPVSLENHKIQRPKFLVLKVADEQKVRIELQAVPGQQGMGP